MISVTVIATSKMDQSSKTGNEQSVLPQLTFNLIQTLTFRIETTNFLPLLGSLSKLSFDY